MQRHERTRQHQPFPTRYGRRIRRRCFRCERNLTSSAGWKQRSTGGRRRIGSPEVSTVEEEELSALMGEKEDYNNADEQNEEQWED